MKISFISFSTSRVSSPLMCILMSGLLFTSACSKSKSTEEAKEDASAKKPARLSVKPFILQNTMAKVMMFSGRDAWIGTSTAGVVKYDTTRETSDAAINFNNTNGLVSNGIFSVTDGPDGSKWIGTYGGGLSRLLNGKWSNYNTQHSLCDSFVYDVQFDKNGDMWVATWSGANFIKGGDIDNPSAWKSYTVENTNGDLSDNWVYALDLAQDGAIWFGTEVGITRYDGKQWSKWTHNDGLGADLDLLKKENEAQTSTLKGSHHSGQEESTGMAKKDIETFNPNHVTAMMFDGKGMLWIGTWGGGLSKFDGKTFTNYTIGNGLAGNYVFSLAIGADGHIWAGTENGISRFDGGTKFTNYDKEDGLLNNVVFALAFDIDGKLWAGGLNGVVRIDEIKG